jgi:hypothetical protein
VGLPHPAQFREHWLRQRDPPFLVPFADDAQRQVSPVDRTDLEGDGLADAQAACVNPDPEAGFVNRAFYATEQAADLVVGQRMWQPLVLRQTNLFLENSGHSQPSVCW